MHSNKLFFSSNKKFLIFLWINVQRIALKHADVYFHLWKTLYLPQNSAWCKRKKFSVKAFNSLFFFFPPKLLNASELHFGHENPIRYSQGKRDRKYCIFSPLCSPHIVIFSFQPFLPHFALSLLHLYVSLSLYLTQKSGNLWVSFQPKCIPPLPSLYLPNHF